MGTVYLAIQQSVGREVALKIMAPALNADPVFSERFQREANIVGQLSHRHIVSIYDIGRQKNLNYIAMDYLPGGSLHDRMNRGIDVKESLNIVSQIAEALDHAHERGYVHRDIKPDNILFRDDGSAVLTDFGVSKTLESASQMTMAGTVVGTPHYMSPEQARGKPIDGRADLYSLGVVLFEMLTGSVPFSAEEPVAVAVKHLTSPIPKLPPHLSYLQPLLAKLLAKEPDDRFQRGNDITSAIAEILDPSSANRSLSQFNKTTDPTAVQILSLLKALSEVTFNALMMKARAGLYWLGSWRYNRDRGFHRRPKTVATQFSITLADSPTLANAPAAHVPPRRKIATRVNVGIITLSLTVALTLLGYKLSSPSPTPLPDTPLPEETMSVGSTAAIPTADHATERKPSAASTTPAPEPLEIADQVTVAHDGLPASLDQLFEGDPFAEQVDERSPVSSNDDTTGDDQTTALPEPPPPPRNEFRVNAQPIGARIRILNIKERYFPGIELVPGSYHIEVSMVGYDPHYQWITMPDKTHALDVRLTKTPVAGEVFHHTLAEGGKGPAMVIVPPGEFNMGDGGSSKSAPVHKVSFSGPFAVSQYEITFAEYQRFAAARNQSVPDDNRWGRGSRPVVNVSWSDAQRYASWLSAQTGKNYRLLSEAEWEYAARANTEGDYYWSSASSEQPVANCKRGCYSPYTSLLKSKTAPVGSFPANPFNLFDLSGNVAEWVADCYQPHYLGAPNNGKAVDKEPCASRAVRGGSLRDPISKLTVHRRDAESPATTSPFIGFRVAVEL